MKVAERFCKVVLSRARIITIFSLTKAKQGISIPPLGLLHITCLLTRHPWCCSITYREKGNDATSKPFSGSPHLIHTSFTPPFVGCLWVLSLGAFSALAFNMGCAQSYRRIPFLGVKSVDKQSASSLRSTGTVATSTTVPSIVVYVTVPNKEAGKKLAESIIQEKLAACVNQVPGIESVYWWDGKVQTDSEELLVIKTRESLLSALTEHVRSNHMYDVPEVIALPINGGNLKYLEWIKNSTREN